MTGGSRPLEVNPRVPLAFRIYVVRGGDTLWLSETGDHECFRGREEADQETAVAGEDANRLRPHPLRGRRLYAELPPPTIALRRRRK